MVNCLFPSLPEGFRPIPENIENSQKIEAIKILNNYDYLPSNYHSCPLLRIVTITLLIVGVAFAILAAKGQLITFPQHVTQFFHSLNWTYVGCGIAGFVVLSVGAGFIIRRTIKKEAGLFWGDSHWKPAFYSCRKSFFCFQKTLILPGYIDTSTLNENGTGEAKFYTYKYFDESYVVSAEVFALTPLHGAAAMAYNVVRAVVIPFYILGCLAIEVVLGHSLFEEQRSFEWSDIPNEIAKSVLRIAKAPFYATAVMYAALYSFIDPVNGRKLGAAIECEWNEGVPRTEGWWSIAGPQRSWKWEGGGGPDKLGRNGFYGAGCWTPMAHVTFKEGKIEKATTTGGKLIERMHTHDELLSRYNENIANAQVTRLC